MTFGGADTGFNGATFSGHARFSEAAFTGDIGFNGATFTRHAGFDESTATGGPQRPHRTATIDSPGSLAGRVAGAPGRDPYAGRLASRDAGSPPRLGKIERRP